MTKQGLTIPFTLPLLAGHLRAPSLYCEVGSRDKSRESKQMESLLLLSVALLVCLLA